MSCEIFPFKFFFITAVALLATLAFCAFARAAGTVTGDFLLVDVPAREVSLGSIYAPFYGRPEASLVNPATLQGINSNYLVFSHYMSVFSYHYEQAEYFHPVDVSSCAGVYFLYSGNDALYRTDDNGVPVEKIDNYDAYLGAVYSRALNEEYNVGATLKLVSSKVYDNASWGAALNLGVLYRNYVNKYTLGLDIENLGISADYFVDKSLYPMILRGGYGTEVFHYEDEYRISVYVEERYYINELDNSQTSFGMEAFYKKFFVFRYGYIIGADQGSVSVGAGVKINDLYIDYAYVPYFISDNAHRFTVKYVF